jgi:hypothetical protein
MFHETSLCKYLGEFIAFSHILNASVPVSKILVLDMNYRIQLLYMRCYCVCAVMLEKM